MTARRDTPPRAGRAAEVGARPAVPRRIWRAALLFVVLSVAATACATAPAEPAAPPVIAARLTAPISEPAWSARAGALFALTAGGRAITRIDPAASGPAGGARQQTVGPEIGDLGRNLAPDAAGDDDIYVPRPGSGRIVVVSESSLAPVASLPGGRDPSYVSTDSGSDHLLVLSGDATTVTPLDLHTGRLLAPQQISGGAGHSGEPVADTAVVEGAKRGRRIDFYVATPAAVLHYKWKLGAIENDGRLPIPAADVAGDRIKTSRLYVAVEHGDRLVAVDVQRGGTGLHVVATARLDGPVLQVATDEDRVFAVTATRLYVFSSSSFEGFAGGAFHLLRAIDYRSAIDDAAARSAPVNGIAVGNRRVYLSLQDVPVLVSVEKPPV